MNLRTLIANHLPKAVVASTILLVFNIFIEGTSVPIRLGTEFLLYTIAIFVGFVVFSLIWDEDPNDEEV